MSCRSILYKTQHQILIEIAAAAENIHAVEDTDVWRKIYCNFCVLSIYSEAQAACTVGHLPHKKS
jgi:hypothetical protein